MRVPSRGLYVVTPDSLADNALLRAVSAAIDGGAVMVQYRQKGLSIDTAHEQALRLLELCRDRGVPLIVNDDCALAQRIGADGVHVGREDAAVSAARTALGADAIVGASCYGSLALGHQAVTDGASYVAFGSIYPSPTKPAAPTVPLDVLRLARCELAVPVCAIGGITADNAGAVVAAGADLLAVISDVFAAADPCAAARRYRSVFAT